MVDLSIVSEILQSCLERNGFVLTNSRIDFDGHDMLPKIEATMYIDNKFPFCLCETSQKGRPKETTAEQNETRPLTELTPKRILKSGNRTIVFWKDGTKTMVKRADDEAESDYAAFTAALAIKLYGSNSAVKRIVDKTETQKSKKQKAQKESEEMTVNLFDGDADWLIAKVEAEAQKE